MKYNKILNLVSPDKSEIKFTKNIYPDGQNNLVIDVMYKEFGQLWLNELLNQTKVTIKSRLNNWLDLELIICAVASLRELGVEEIHLYTPYIVGARSDRKFEEGGNNYLKDVICPVINSLNFKTVTCIDPHSDVLEACIKGFRKEDNSKLVSWAISHLPRKKQWKYNDMVLVSPDAGASKKIYKLAEQIGYKGDIITCSKDRDTEGKLTKTVVPYSRSENDLKKDYIIIDDICDGGATFINIAKEIKKHQLFTGKIYLIVTHGIFSKGFEELSEYFDGIYCTNSYQDIERDSHFSEDLIFDKEYDEKVKQLNVF